MDIEYSEEKPKGNWETVAVFSFGVFFVIAILLLAIFFDEPTHFQYTTFRIVLALAVAGVAASVPGFLHLEIGRTIRAGGALAVFVVVYFFSPAALVAKPPLPPKEDAQKAIASWLNKIDSGDYELAWGEISEEGQRRFYRDVFLEAFENQRRPLGLVVDRKLYGTSQLDRLPDGTIGNFGVYVYRTKFDKLDNPMLEQIFVIVEKDRWKILSHMLFPDNFNSGINSSITAMP